jgi:prophage tail gpP-like protein
MEVVVNGKSIAYFNSGTINLKLDSIASTFEFSAYFKPQEKDFQEIFKPLQYLPVEIYNENKKLIFTGTILNHRFTSNKGREVVIISGYSKSGILEDVTIPPSENYSLENNNKSLKDIATQLCGIFGINVVVSDQAKSISESGVNPTAQTTRARSDFDSIKAKANVVFGRTSASPTESIRDYLAKLASQKNIILSHNEKGEVLLFQPDYNQLPRYFFTKGNTISMTADYNGQALHSDIYIVRQPSDENEGVSTFDRAKNTLVAKYRPTTKIMSSGEDAQTKDAAKNELAAELKAITLTLELQGLFDEIYPGEIVNVHNHHIYCYAYNRFMVDSITLKFDSKSDTTTLNLVVPETFTGGELIRDILYNHLDENFHIDDTLNELEHQYVDDRTIE